MNDDLQEIVVHSKFTNYDIVNGSSIPALDRLKIISEDEYECIITEWATEYLSNKYQKIRRASGAGDKGRDVIAFIDDLNYDNYQCKHYKEKLSPADIWIEIGKLCYYTYTKEYITPQKYYFVSPLGAGPKLSNLIDRPEEIKNGLISKWETYCEQLITSTKKILLDDDFKKYIDNFDFSIITDLPPNDFIIQYQTTKFYAARFGGGLTKYRPETKIVDTKVEFEKRYIEQLINAYNDYKQDKIKNINDLKSKYPELYSHLLKERICYHSANALESFIRDTLPDSKPFDLLKQDFFDGLIDIVNSKYNNGYECVQQTTKEAGKLQISNIIEKDTHFRFSNKDRHGICHQLADEDKFIWVKK
jgi:hypothetical protein